MAEDLFERGLCLPSGTAMTEADLNTVVDVIGVDFSLLFKAVLFMIIATSYLIAGGYKMGGSLKHMSKKERQALERFAETIKSRLGEYLVRMSVFGLLIGAGSEFGRQDNRSN